MIESKSKIINHYLTSDEGIKEKEIKLQCISTEKQETPHRFTIIKLGNNPNTIQKIKDSINKLLDIPILFTYQVNVFYYPKHYNSLTVNDLLKDIDPDDISSEFINFIVRLGQFDYEKIKNNDIVIENKDDIYNIQFILMYKYKVIERKNAIINPKSVNIIWIDNPYIYLDSSDSFL